MIAASALLDPLCAAGFGLWSGVPCSYLTPLINGVIDDPRVRYVGAANEGDAVAVAAAASLAGDRGVVLFQNSGFGNAVNPLTSLCEPFRLPVLVIATWRGQPGGAGDEPQHRLMGRITPDLFDLMGIPWALLPEREEEVADTVGRAVDWMDREGLPFGLIVRKGTVAPRALESGPTEEARPAPRPALLPFDDPPVRSDDALAAVQAAVGADHGLIATTGFTGRALYARGDHPNQLYVVGSMGCAAPLTLGLATLRPDRRFVVLDGDGALLMRMGALATVGFEGPSNFAHVLLDNGVHDSTGAQATVSPRVDFAGAAWACGYRSVARASSASDLADRLAERPEGPALIHVRTRPREDRRLPRPTLGPAEVAGRFREWMGAPDPVGGP